MHIARIAKTFTFDAAHRIPGLPDTHPCSRLHGHTYEVELQIVGPVDEKGFVVDYADIASAWVGIAAQIDHRYLNEVPGLETPTTEVLAAWIYGSLCGHPTFQQNTVGNTRTTLLERVRIKESSTTWCEVLGIEVARVAHRMTGQKLPIPWTAIIQAPWKL